MNNTSPLEQLAAFAICFAAGAISVLALNAYSKVARPKLHPVSS